MSATTPTLRVARIERIDRLLGQGIARVRLSDGATVRMHEETARTMVAHAGAFVAYRVDAVGNRYDPRAATLEEIAAARPLHYTGR